MITKLKTSLQHWLTKGNRMSVYTPDKWVVVKLTNNDNETHYRVFANWYGGYLGSDSWKLNSGITNATLVDNVYEFAGSSGSMYKCYENGYGTSGYGQNVLTHLIEDAKESITIEVMSEDTDFLELEYK